MSFHRIDGPNLKQPRIISARLPGAILPPPAPNRRLKEFAPTCSPHAGAIEAGDLPTHSNTEDDHYGL